MSATAAITVAIQGERGAYSELAAYEFFSPRVDIKPCASFADLFAAVERGAAHYGMAPVDNSLGGSIHPVWDLLARRRLPIAGEIQLRIQHCLIAHPDTRLQDLRRVYSHAQALSQCQAFLHRLEGVDQEEVYDTAGAVKMIAGKGNKEEAAIASAQAAVDYGMAILAEDIQTDPRNFTRFLVLSHQACDFSNSALKTTLVFELADNARTLPQVLGVFVDHRIEPLKIESCKRLGHPWEYTFYLEFNGGASEPHIAAALDEVGKQVSALHLVGSYPPGRISEARLHPR